MALSNMIYDPNRDMYFANQPLTLREQYEKEMIYRRQEEEYRRMQNSYVSNTQPQQLVNTAPKPDLKDPLAFLQNTDKKLLLTGEMQ